MIARGLDWRASFSKLVSDAIVLGKFAQTTFREATLVEACEAACIAADAHEPNTTAVASFRRKGRHQQAAWIFPKEDAGNGEGWEATSVGECGSAFEECEGWEKGGMSRRVCWG